MTITNVRVVSQPLADIGSEYAFDSFIIEFQNNTTATRDTIPNRFDST